MPAPFSSCRAWLRLWGRGRNRQPTPCPGLRNETLQHRGRPDSPCQAPCLYLGIAQPNPCHAFPHSAGLPRAGLGMNREGAPGKSPEEMYIQQKVRVLLMLRKMGSNVSAAGCRATVPQGGCLVQAEQRL